MIQLFIFEKKGEINLYAKDRKSKITQKPVFDSGSERVNIEVLKQILGCISTIVDSRPDWNQNQLTIQVKTNEQHPFLTNSQ